MNCAYAVAHDPSARYAGTSPRFASVVFTHLSCVGWESSILCL
jgi:hypothetical protein